MNHSNEIINIYREALINKDFKTFASYCRVYSGIKGDFMMLKHSSWTNAQKIFERNRTGKDIVLKPRRIGFTTLEYARDLFFALTNPGSTTLIITQSEDLAKDSIRALKDIIDNLRDMEKKLNIPFSLVPGLKTDNSFEIIFTNRSVIKATQSNENETSANKNLRGINISRLHCTEVAFWTFGEYTMQAAMIAAKHAKEIVIESTPNGSKGYFYDFYNRVKNGDAGPQWKSHFFPWFIQEDNKSKFDTREQKEQFDLSPSNQYEETLIEQHKITKEQLKWWREQVAQNPFGIASVLQEYPIDEASCFRLKSQSFLDADDFEWLEKSWVQPIERIPMPLAGNDESAYLHVWKHPEQGKRYIIGADTAYGSSEGTGDYSCFYVIEQDSGQICACFSSNKINPTVYGKIVALIARKYNKAFVAVEWQASGGTVIVSLQQEGYTNLYRQSNKEFYGWITTGNNRIEMFNLLQKMVKDRDPQIVDYNMVSQFKNLILKDNKIQHLKNTHDDHLMAFMIAQIVRRNVPVIHSTGYQSISKSKIGNMGFSRIGSKFAKGFSIRG